MGNETYSVTLDKDEVTKAQAKYLDYGGKLSPLLNKLLKDWNEKNKNKMPKDKKEDKPKSKLSKEDADLMGDELIVGGID